MISHRLLSTEVYGNGLRGRVTACRKRLRVNRVAQRTQGSHESGALFAETVPASRVRDYGDTTERPTRAASIVRLNYASPGAGAEPVESETLLSVAEEVGST